MHTWEASTVDLVIQPMPLYFKFVDVINAALNFQNVIAANYTKDWTKTAQFIESSSC